MKNRTLLFSNWLYSILFIFSTMFLLTGCFFENESGIEGDMYNRKSNEFSLISSDENKEIVEYLQKFGEENNIKINVKYASTIEIMEELNKNKEIYDGVFIANSMWTYMLDNPYLIVESKPVYVNPVVWGIVRSKLVDMGFPYVIENILLDDILVAIKDYDLKFLMPSPTQTNSGASSYFGFVNSILDNPPFLTKELLSSPELEEQLNSLFGGVERVSGEEGYIKDTFLNGNYEAVVDYEASIISLNQELRESNKEELILLYPDDGVAISDVSFGYIDNKINGKKEQFLLFQQFLLEQETQDYILGTGRRGGYGGYFPEGYEEVFRREWGINVKKPLTAMKYPSKENIVTTLHLYQDIFRKPSITVFCLDYSGSMSGDGETQLKEAMKLILDNNEASKYFIQFGEKDKLVFYPFNHDLIHDYYDGSLDISNFDMIQELSEIPASGGTDIYIPLIEALEFMETIQDDNYTKSIVLMTDGMSEVYNKDSFFEYYNNYSSEIPVYSITFGQAEEQQLDEISNLTNGKTFDGKENLIKAFKTVRGFN